MQMEQEGQNYGEQQNEDAGSSSKVSGDDNDMQLYSFMKKKNGKKMKLKAI